MSLSRLGTFAYLLAFFFYLFAPLAVMGLTAFNTANFPSAWPIEGVTLDWFAARARDEEMLYGLRNSLWIGFLVVLVSVPTGLAGALMMQYLAPRLRGVYYVLTVAPVLIPGVIIGIATVIFWREVTLSAGMRFLYNGTMLTVLGQSSFISAYCMLIFTARLQRFDGALEEAAGDLGASQTQVFLHILLPYLRPAVFSAAALAFLSSFENYNTTTFAILADKTLTTVLAGQVRQGTTPAVSALAVLIIGATVISFALMELWRNRQALFRGARRAAVTQGAGTAPVARVPAE